MAWLAFLSTLGLIQSCSSRPRQLDGPSCLIPVDQKDIHCQWTLTLTGQPTNYTLHWRRDGSEFALEASASGGLIPREGYDTLSEVAVWVTVTTSDPLGTHTHTSAETHFHPSNVMQPPAPRVSGHEFVEGSVEVLWSWAPESGSECAPPAEEEEEEEEEEEGMRCTVRYCTRCTPALQHWTQKEGVALHHFLLVKPLPFTQYQFQVRCTCAEIMSLWSDTYTLITPEAAPVGGIDVWRDCDSSSSLSSCNITWKDPDASLLRGGLVAFDFSEFRNGTVRRRSLTRAACTNETGVCVCRQVVSTNETGVCVSAHTARGVTEPSCLNLLQPTEPPSMQFTVRGEEHQGLTASWSPPNQLSEKVQEYVLQRQRAGLPFPEEFDWIRVKKDQNLTILKGNFRDCTPYRVSLFTISGNQSSLIASTVAFSRQCAPPRVMMFDVRTTHDSASLSWAHTPLKDARGHILQYRVQFTGTVYNVSGDSTQYELRGLQPAHTYEVSIRAETDAGVGNSTNRTFTTGRSPGPSMLVVVFGVAVVCVVLCGLPAGICMRKSLCSRCGYVPDPKHSQLLAEFNHLWRPLQSYSFPEHVQTSSSLEVIRIPNKMEHLYPPTRDHLYPDTRREHLYSDTKELALTHPLDGEESTNQEWICIPTERERQEEEEEEEEDAGRSEECGFCRPEEYRDSHALDEEEDEWSADREEEEEEEEGSSDNGLSRQRDEEEEEEEDWNFFQEPDSGYERHMPIAQC